MWYDNLDKNKFLISLYNNVPDLNNVKIQELTFSREKDLIKLIFDMPKFADNIPKKWLNTGSNTISVELNFWNIQNLKMNFNNLLCRANIKITNDNEKLRVILDGDMNCEFFSEYGMIQRIEAYIEEKLS